MSRTLLEKGLVLSLALLPLSAAPTPRCAPQDAPPGAREILDSLDWLAGEWRGKVGENVFEACYTSPEGGEILSCSKEVAGGRAVFYELERFFVRGDEVVLVPHPAGKASVEFPLADWDPEARKATFANEEHDFPKTLTYQRAGDTRLVITLTGDEGGKARTETYDLALRNRW